MTTAAGGFALRPILPSCMYGTTHISEILPEVARIGSHEIDVWPRIHGAQREQIDEMGLDAFQALLDEHEVRVAVLTRFDLGPFGLEPELHVAERLATQVVVTGSSGPKGLQGEELRDAVRAFADKVHPHVAEAEQKGVTIAIENHSAALIDKPDAVRWLMDFEPSPHLGIALAPYHLPQDEALIAGLIDDLGDRLALFYAWQEGMGCFNKLPKEQELLQLPGRGPLDFTPILAALRRIGYNGGTEVFMHPVPRGIPILDTTDAVTHEIIRAQRYLERCLSWIEPTKPLPSDSQTGI